LSRTAAVSPGDAGITVAAVAAVRTVTKLLLELDIDIREHRRGPGLDDNRLRGVELHRIERSGPAAEAIDGDVRSRWMMSADVSVMLVGSIVSPGAAISIAACKAASVLALNFTEPPAPSWYWRQSRKLDRGVDALTGVPVRPSIVPPDKVDNAVVSCAAFCPEPTV